MRSPSRYVDIDFLLEKGNFMDAGSLNSSVSLEWRVEGMALCVYVSLSGVAMYVYVSLSYTHTHTHTHTHLSVHVEAFVCMYIRHTNDDTETHSQIVRER